MILLCSRGGPLGSPVLFYLLLLPQYLPSRVIVVKSIRDGLYWGSVDGAPRFLSALVEDLLWTLFFTMPWQSPCCAPSLLAAAARFTPFYSFMFDGFVVAPCGTGWASTAMLQQLSSVSQNLHLSTFTDVAEITSKVRSITQLSPSIFIGQSVTWSLVILTYSSGRFSSLCRLIPFLL